jgi:hypothetical protein
MVSLLGNDSVSELLEINVEELMPFFIGKKTA